MITVAILARDVAFTIYNDQNWCKAESVTPKLLDNVILEWQLTGSKEPFYGKKDGNIFGSCFLCRPIKKILTFLRMTIPLCTPEAIFPQIQDT